MGEQGFKIKPIHLLVIVIAVFLIYSGYIVIPGLNLGGTKTKYPCPYNDGYTFDTQAELNAHLQSAHGSSGPSPTTHPAAAMQFQISDFITGGATTDHPAIDICQAIGGTFDLFQLSYTDSTVDTPDQSTIMYADGAELILHCDNQANPANPGTGLDYYDRWFYVKVHEGNPIYFLQPSMLSAVTSGTHYTYTVNIAGASTTGFFVSFTSGTMNYWDIGKLPIYPRCAAAGLNLYLTYSGTTLSSVVDASTWVTDSSTANATLAGNTEKVDLLLTTDTANHMWGMPMLYLTSAGALVEYKPVVILSTNMTAIDTSELQSEGWLPINDNTLYAEKAFYKVVGPYYTMKGSTWTATIQVPVYCAAASSGRYILKMWIMDFMNTANVAIGSTSTSIPTTYGFINGYGPGAIEQARAFSTSSGAGSGQAITGWVTK